MKNYPTPHINATPEDFAKTVLMPGDPQRSEFIAKNFLTDAKLVNNVRGIQGYTGYYKGHKISVMASGMGMSSMGIYSHELFSFFGVENIIRIGTIGALREDIKLKDIIIGMGACTDNISYSNHYSLDGIFAPIASYKLLRTATDEAEKMNINVRVGNILSTDKFYKEISDEPWAKMGVLGIEMESASLYMNAARIGKNALAICSVSDNIITKEQLDSEARSTQLIEMIKLALETAIKL